MTAPRPKFEASVATIKVLVKSGKLNIGAPAMMLLMDENASLHSLLASNRLNIWLESVCENGGNSIS